MADVTGAPCAARVPARGGACVLRVVGSSCMVRIASAELRGQRDQRVLVVVAEAQVLARSRRSSTPSSAPPHDDRHRELAARIRQARATGSRSRAVRHAVAPRRCRGSRGRRRTRTRRVHDADRRALARGHADHAVADGDLRAHARRVVAAARDGVEPLARARRASAPSRAGCRALVERRERVVEQRAEVGDSPPSAARTRRSAASRLRARRRRRAAGCPAPARPRARGRCRSRCRRNTPPCRCARRCRRASPSCARTAGPRSRCAGTRARGGSARRLAGRSPAPRARGFASTFWRVLLKNWNDSATCCAVDVVHLRHVADVGRAVGGAGRHRRPAPRPRGSRGWRRASGSCAAPAAACRPRAGRLLERRVRREVDRDAGRPRGHRNIAHACSAVYPMSADLGREGVDVVRDDRGFARRRPRDTRASSAFSWNVRWVLGRLNATAMRPWRGSRRAAAAWIAAR